MKFSYNAVWDHTVPIVRALLPLLLAIAGVFMFLPTLLLNYFAPVPAMTGADARVMMQTMSDYFLANWYWYLIASLFEMVGTLAIWVLIFDKRRPTVLRAIGEGLILLPSYLACVFLTRIVLIIIFLLIAMLVALLLGPTNPLILLVAIFPCLYLFGRVAVVGQVIVAEDRRGPFNALARTIELTRGKGWGIAGMIVTAFLLVGVAGLAVRTVVGIVLRLLIEAKLATFIELVVVSAAGAAMQALVIALYAGIYRALVPPRSAAAIVD